MKIKEKVFSVIGILIVVIFMFFAINDDFFDKKIENSADVKFLAASTNNKALNLDYGLKEYSIHESENLVFYLNVKNESDKASNNVYVRLASWTKPMRIIDSDTKNLEDSVTYKVDGKTADFSIDCLTSCAKINGNVTATTAIQSVGIQLGTIPAGKSATLEVKFKWVGEEKQDTMFGVWKKLSAEVHEKNADYSKTISSNYKVLSYDVMKSVHRQEITLVDKDGNVINDLHDLEVKDNKVTAYLNIDYNYLTDPTKHFGEGLTYFDGKAAVVNVSSAAEEPEYYKNFNLRKLRIILPEGVEYNSSGFKSDLLDLKSQTNNTNKTFDLEPKANVTNIKTTINIPLSISTAYLNKQFCITPSYVEKAAPTTYITDVNGLSGVNKYCVGPYLSIYESKITATKTGTYSDGDVGIDLKVAIRNKNLEYEENGEVAGTDQSYVEGNGRAQSAVVSYNVSKDAKVDVNLLPDNVSYNKDKGIITVVAGDIKYNHVGYVTIPLKVSKDLTTYKITKNTLSVEGKKVTTDKNITIGAVVSNNIKGDWDQSGKVSLNDLVYARQYITGIKDLRLPPVEIYDFNGDKKVGPGDIIGLRQLLVTQP
ncbi:MAG: hypothetical protein IJA94_04650 [Bacilli bacterium]|nr:hypothetical protein [Bacilli bacterium]